MPMTGIFSPVEGMARISISPAAADVSLKPALGMIIIAAAIDVDLNRVRRVSIFLASRVAARRPRSDQLAICQGIRLLLPTS